MLVYVDEKIFSKSKISKGKPKEYYDSKKYTELALAVRINDDDHRIIYKAKGDENICVMVIVPETEDINKGLDFILNPDITKEINRVYYVALSRAMDKLFISVLKIRIETKLKLSEIGFDITECANRANET